MTTLEFKMTRHGIELTDDQLDECRSYAIAETLARKGKEAQHRENNEVSDAEQYADMAIRQLQRIRNDDPNAETQLERVSNWIAERMHAL